VLPNPNVLQAAGSTMGPWLLQKRMQRAVCLKSRAEVHMTTVCSTTADCRTLTSADKQEAAAELSRSISANTAQRDCIPDAYCCNIVHKQLNAGDNFCPIEPKPSCKLPVAQ